MLMALIFYSSLYRCPLSDNFVRVLFLWLSHVAVFAQRDNCTYDVIRSLKAFSQLLLLLQNFPNLHRRCHYLYFPRWQPTKNWICEWFQMGLENVTQPNLGQLSTYSFMSETKDITLSHRDRRFLMQHHVQSIICAGYLSVAMLTTVHADYLHLT